MPTAQSQSMGIYVHRASQQWIVRDRSGRFWLLPVTDNPWGDRQPFVPEEEMELEPVPGHYKYLLGLPA